MKAIVTKDNREEIAASLAWLDARTMVSEGFTDEVRDLLLHGGKPYDEYSVEDLETEIKDRAKACDVTPEEFVSDRLGVVGE